MDKTTKELLNIIKTNDIDQIQKFVSNNDPSKEKDFDLIFTKCSHEKIEEIIKNWQQKKMTKKYKLDKKREMSPNNKENNNGAVLGHAKRSSNNYNPMSSIESKAERLSKIEYLQKICIEEVLPKVNKINKSTVKAENKGEENALIFNKNDDLKDKDLVNNHFNDNNKNFLVKKDLDVKKGLESNKNANPNLIIKDYLVFSKDKNRLITLFYDAMCSNNSKVSYEIMAEVSVSLVEALDLVVKSKDNTYVRTKIWNLKDKKNPELCHKVCIGEITAKRYIEMTNDEMKSEEEKKTKELILKDALCDVQAPKLHAETDNFQCEKCKERKTTWYQMQTRSADEPMTTFVTCVFCYNKWKVY